MNNSIDPVRIIYRSYVCMLVYIMRNVRPDMEYDLFILHVSTHAQAFTVKNTLNTWVDKMKVLYLWLSLF